jgi:hypothetical protein
MLFSTDIGSVLALAGIVVSISFGVHVLHIRC